MCHPESIIFKRLQTCHQSLVWVWNMICMAIIPPHAVASLHVTASSVPDNSIFLLNSLLTSRTSKLSITIFCEGNNPWLVVSPHKGLVMTKAIPCLHIIIYDHITNRTHLNIKTVFSRNRDSNVKDKKVVRPSCLVHPGVRYKWRWYEIDLSQPRHETALRWHHNGPVTSQSNDLIKWLIYP